MHIDEILEQLKYHSSKYVYYLDMLSQAITEMNLPQSNKPKAIRMDDTVTPFDHITKP